MNVKYLLPLLENIPDINAFSSCLPFSEKLKLRSSALTDLCSERSAERERVCGLLETLFFSRFFLSELRVQGQRMSYALQIVKTPRGKL